MALVVQTGRPGAALIYIEKAPEVVLKKSLLFYERPDFTRLFEEKIKGINHDLDTFDYLDVF